MGRTSKVWKRKDRGFWSTVHRRQIFLGYDLNQAKRKLAALLKSSQPILPGQFSVAELVKIFLADCNERIEADEMSRETFKSYRSYLLRWAEACRRIRPEHLRAYHLKAWIDSHETWNTTSSADAVSRVKLWSRWCVSEGYLETDGLSTARAPQRLTRDAADPEDLLRLERAIGCPFFRDWFHCLYDTGCRPGELRALCTNDFNLLNRTAQVIGKSGQRIVGLAPRMRDILKRLSLVHPSGPLLRTVNGAEWTQSNIKYHWDRWRTIAGLPGTLVPYHVRHSLWSRWHAAGISDIVISRQLGHFSKGVPHIRLLQSTYGHASATDLAQAAQLASSNDQKRKVNRGASTTSF